MTTDDTCDPRGIPRASRDELRRARRLRVLTAILDDEESPFRNRLLDLADMHIETAAEIAVSNWMWQVHTSAVDLPGSPPPRRDR